MPNVASAYKLDVMGYPLTTWPDDYKLYGIYQLIYCNDIKSVLW